MRLFVPKNNERMITKKKKKTLAMPFRGVVGITPGCNVQSTCWSPVRLWSEGFHLCYFFIINIFYRSLETLAQFQQSF